MSSLRPRFVVSPHRRGGLFRNNKHLSFTKGGKKFGSVGLGFGGGFKTNNRAREVVDSTIQRGNIKVVVRVRGPNPSESGPSRRLIVQAVDEQLVIFDPKEEDQDFYFHGEKQKSGRDLLKRTNKDKKFMFDNVYGPSHSNQEIFDGTIKPTIDTILSGCNCSIFAYGATGSGKTYTMLGSPGNPGITFFTVMELYSRLTEMSIDHETEIQVSYVEVYNEEVKDLLSSSGILTVREDANGGTVIPELTFHKPKDSDQLFQLLTHGNSIRSQHPTDHNAESSRSHAIFQVYLRLRGRFTNMNNSCRTAKLVMVDLAGSERGTATGFKGQRFREGSSINKSLLALGNCINALADGKKHVPYRDSKLTRILKDALGGNCKTVMIANVSPSDTSYNETFNTLRYADRAKRIKFQVKKNLLTVHARIAQYGLVVDEMSEQIESLKRQLKEKIHDCRCKVQKQDAATETVIETHSCMNVTFQKAGNNGHISGSNSGDFDEFSEIEDDSLLTENQNKIITDSQEIADYLNYLTKKRQVEKDYFEFLCRSKEVGIKISFKENRINSAEALKSKDMNATKGVERLKKQLRGLHSQQYVNKSHSNQKKLEVDVIEESIGQLANQISDDRKISIPIAEYLKLKSLEINGESKFLSHISHGTTVQTFLQDELSNSETLLCKAMVLLKPIHLLLKHHGHTTKDNDDSYNNLMADFFGNRIHFADSVNFNKEGNSHISVMFENKIDENKENRRNLNPNSPAHTNIPASINSQMYKNALTHGKAQTYAAVASSHKSFPSNPK